jgi:VanZ family protein
VRESVLSEVPRTTRNAWLPVIVWAGVIFALSSVPRLGTDLGTLDLVLRKLAHAAEYAVLGALLVRALSSRFLAAMLGVGYAASDEWHQTFVNGREGSASDVLVDAVGIALGILLWSRVSARRRAT